MGGTAIHWKRQVPPTPQAEEGGEELSVPGSAKTPPQELHVGFLEAAADLDPVRLGWVAGEETQPERGGPSSLPSGCQAVDGTAIG